MRKLLVTSFFALTLLISAAPAAHAAVVCSVSTLGQSCDPGNGSAGICRQSPDDGSYGCGPVVTNAAPGTYGAQAADAQAQAAAAKTATDNGPKMDEALGGVMTWIMSLFAWLLGVAVITLDSAVYYTVITMGDYVNKLSAVGVTWRILRDIGNIALIFGFLAVGITTILNVNWYGSGSKMLPKMLMAAVFLNFSLFITEAIIDTGNLFATQFYTQINGGKLPTGTLKWDDIGNAGKTGIAGKIMNQLGLATIYSSALTKKDVLPSGTSIFIGFMSIILFIVAAFVMFSLAFVLIARFVALIFLIILAPIGFAGLAIPQLAARAKKWWDTLFEQTITAPILLLMLYIALAIITDANFLGFGPKGDWTGFVPGNGGTNFAGFASMLLSFLVAMGLLMAVVVQSKNLSAIGAAGASKLAGKLTFGATAWAANRTVGRGAYLASRGLRQSQTFNKLNAVTGRVMSGTLDRAATGSFDIRGSKAFGGLKNVGLGVEAGAASKGGFTEARKQNIKAHEEEAKRIEEAHKDALWETSADKKAIEEAKADLVRAKSGRDITKTEHDVALQEVKIRQAELKRIEEEKIMTPDRDARLAAARGALDTSTKKQADLKDALGKLDDIVKNLAEAEKNANGAAEKRMKDSITASKTAYAEGIDHPLNPITFVAYGPDTAAAARKIKSSMKEKPTKDKFLELAKKMAKETEEAEGKEKTETVEEPKPEAVKTKPSDT